MHELKLDPNCPAKIYSDFAFYFRSSKRVSESVYLAFNKKCVEHPYAINFSIDPVDTHVR